MAVAMITPVATSVLQAKTTALATCTTRDLVCLAQQSTSVPITAIVLSMRSVLERLALVHVLAMKATKVLAKHALRSTHVQIAKRPRAIAMLSAPILVLVNLPAPARVASLVMALAAPRSTTVSLVAAVVCPIPCALRLDQAPMTALAHRVMLVMAEANVSRSIIARAALTVAAILQNACTLPLAISPARAYQAILAMETNASRSMRANATMVAVQIQPSAPKRALAENLVLANLVTKEMAFLAMRATCALSSMATVASMQHVHLAPLF